MKKLGSFNKEFLKFLFINPGQKFLGILKKKRLYLYEAKLGINLGAFHRKIRPLIFWIDEKGCFYLLFLTTSRITISINLDLCKEKNKLCKNIPFYHNSFVLLTPDKKPVIFKIKEPLLINEIYFCGRCKDLEYLENSL